MCRNDLKGLIINNVDWSAKTAGPSYDDNKRIEVFLQGCSKAMSGNPCKGCFNKSTWDSSKAERSHEPAEVAKTLAGATSRRCVTIGGGEPTDQIDNLIPLCRELKEYGFHIMMYTWRDLKFELGLSWSDYRPYENKIEIGKWHELLKYVDMIVDGEYMENERLWNGALQDGFFSSIGSGNQTVWDINRKIGYRMRDLAGLRLSTDNKLSFLVVNDNMRSFQEG